MAWATSSCLGLSVCGNPRYYGASWSGDVVNVPVTPIQRLTFSRHDVSDMLARLFECPVFDQLSCRPPDAENQKSSHSRMLSEAAGHSHSTTYRWNFECTLQSDELEIVRESDGKRVTVRQRAEFNPQVSRRREQMRGDAERIGLDLEEVTLVRE